MKVTIAVDMVDEFVEVTLEGTIPVKVGAKARSDALTLAKEHGFRRLLFDARDATLDFGTVDLHDFASRPETDGLTRRQGHRESDTHIHDTLPVTRQSQCWDSRLCVLRLP